MLNCHDVHFLDVVGLVDDPSVGLRYSEEASQIQLELGMMLNEIQSLPAAVATDYFATMLRSANCDLESIRGQINKKLRAIDVVRGVLPTESHGPGELLQTIKAQTDRIERIVSREDGDRCGVQIMSPSGAIDPAAYYDYMEVAGLLGVSQSTIYRLKAKGRLRAVEIGRRVKFLGEDILSLADATGDGIRVLRVEPR